jgi:hypothetical protein
MFAIAHIDETLGIRKFEFKSLYDLFAYNKYDIWEHEKEWRLFTLEDKPDDIRYSDQRFNFNKIDSVIFGCKCLDTDIHEIVSIVNSKKGNVNFLKAKRHNYEYKLEFAPLSL